MKIDNRSLMKIMSMNDEELGKVIAKAAKESGLDLPSMSVADIAKVRAALNGVNNDPKAIDEIMRASEGSDK